MKQIVRLDLDYKRTAEEPAQYELYQDLQNPKSILLVKFNTVGASTVETYYIKRVQNSTELDALWADRANLTYKNLIDILSEN